MEQPNKNVIEIKVKGILIGEYNDFESWKKAQEQCGKEFGVTSKVLSLDCNGLTTTGYNLKNTLRDTVYPVKIYLLIQDDQIVKPMLYQSPSNN